ncbi:MAG: TlpA disulfide reductase family protein [Gemmatimonadales bacterium]|jgi:thiol-disulfide isomerase/thioredoxin
MIRYLREIAMLVVIGIVTVGAVYLIRQNRTLAEQNRLLARQAVDPRAGLFVPTLGATTLDGEPAVLGQLGRRQLLFFFNHTCPFCRASIPAWNAVARELDGDSIAVFGIALDSAPVATVYATEQGLGFPVIAKPEPRLVGLYRVSGVPLILVVDDGRMTYARLGVLESPAAMDSVVVAALGDVRGTGSGEGS